MEYRNQILLGDNLEIMRGMADDSVDLVFTSPPYEAARTYGIGFNLKGQEWVDWCVERYMECLRICKGLVAWNVEGQTRQFRWSATPALLMADLHRRGVHLRKPPLYVREGIPGSGGPDWLKNKYEFIICGTGGGQLPWSDNTAMGHKPMFGKGGHVSHRGKNGARKTFSRQSRREENGDRYKPSEADDGRPLPDLSNPGNLIDCGANTNFGLGNENEAPFPMFLCEYMIRSFCPPETGVVLDPHCGSGTVLAVAEKWGRKWIGIDCRESQAKLSKRRVDEVRKPLFTEDSA